MVKSSDSKSYVYEYIHIIVNIIISYIQYETIYNYLFYGIKESNIFNNNLCFAIIIILIFFHTIFFKHNEKYHHLFTIILIILSYLFYNCFNSSVILFIMHGLPGIFTYTIYILYKYNFISENIYKFIKFIINLIIRIPIPLFMIMTDLYYNFNDNFNVIYILCSIIIISNLFYYTIESFKSFIRIKKD